MNKGECVLYAVGLREKSRRSNQNCVYIELLHLLLLHNRHQYQRIPLNCQYVWSEMVEPCFIQCHILVLKKRNSCGVSHIVIDL